MVRHELPPVRSLVARRGGLLLTWALLLTVAACDCNGAKTGQATTGVTLVDPAGDSDQFERTVDLGAIRVGSLVTKKLVFRNDGRSTAAITKASLDTQSPDLFLDVPDPLPSLEPKEEWALELRYRPGEIGADEGTVTVETDAQDTPKYTVHVKGRGASSQLDVCSTDAQGAEVCVSQQSDGRLVIDVGAVKPGSELRKPLVVKNGGDAKLSVTSVQPTASTSDEFTIAPSGDAFAVDAGGKKALEVVYDPADGGPDEGAIEVVSDDPANPRLLVYLKAEGLAPHLCVSPTSIDFGEQALGGTGHKTLTLTSCGKETVTLRSAVVATAPASPFAIANLPSLPKDLAPGEALALDVTYTPTQFGESFDRLVLQSSAPGQERGFINLTGRAVGCTLQIVPGSVAFGQVSQGGHTAKTIQVRNTGTGNCTVNEVRAPAAPFAVDRAPAAPFVVGAGQAETIVVSFSPTAQGSQSGQLVLATNDPRGDIPVPLSGQGISAPPCDLQPTPANVLFNGVSTGQSATQNVLVKNFGTSECYVNEAKVVGITTPADFKVTAGGGFPPPSIPSGGSMNVPVIFAPTQAGVHKGTLKITYSDQPMSVPIPGFPAPGGRTLDVPLEGGTLAPALCLDPPALDYGVVQAGSSKELSFNIRSCGQGALGLRGLSIGTGSSVEFSLVSPPHVPQFLAVGQQLTVRVVYKPTSQSADFGNVLVLNNDPAQPRAMVKLRANASQVCDKQLACNRDQLTFPTMEIGRSSSLSVVCQNVGTQPLTVTGAGFARNSSTDFKATVGRTPQTVAPGGVVRVEVTYTPQDAGNDQGQLVINSDACQPATVNLDAAGKQPNYPRCNPPLNFTPVEKWSWSGGATQSDSKNVEMTPIVINLDDDNADGRIDENDIPDVLFTSCRSSQCCERCLAASDLKNADFAGRGMLRAVHGQNGGELWNVTDTTLMLTGTTMLAAGDLDGDNLPEIIGVKYHFQPGSGNNGMAGKYKQGTLLVFDNTGKLKFETEQWLGDENALEQSSAPTISDLDGDGQVEIVMERTVFHADGSRFFDMPSSGNAGHGAWPSVSDVDGDGVPEIISGKYCFRADGTLKWTGPGDNGPSMVIDVDNDGKPEVILRDSATSLRVLNGADGTEKVGKVTWPAPAIDGSHSDNSICAASMAAADLDGDKKPDIIVPSGDKLYAFRGYNGQQMWTAPIDDYGGQCGASGAAAFDFDGDGKFEAVYHDTNHMYAFRGTDGLKIYDAPRNSSTLFETPVVADVDNDGHADLVMTNENGVLGIGSGAGVKVLSNTGNNWVSTRRVWNQYGYHVSDVNENGSIPRSEVPHWKSTNSWRANTALCKP